MHVYYVPMPQLACGGQRKTQSTAFPLPCGPMDGTQAHQQTPLPTEPCGACDHESPMLWIRLISDISFTWVTFVLAHKEASSHPPSLLVFWTVLGWGGNGVLHILGKCLPLSSILQFFPVFISASYSQTSFSNPNISEALTPLPCRSRIRGGHMSPYSICYTQ